MSQPTPEAIRLLVRRGAMLTQHHHRGQLYAVGLNLDGGFLFGNKAELRFGVGYASVDLDVLIGQ